MKKITICLILFIFFGIITNLIYGQEYGRELDSLALVALLVSERQPPGSYEVEFNGESLAPGIYYYILKTNSWQDIKKMILLK